MTKTQDTRTGTERIAEERKRQLEKLGWTDSHDDEHDSEELALVACCYATTRPLFVQLDRTNGVSFIDPWPFSWDDDYDARPSGDDGSRRKPTRAERIRLLEKSGALIAAEIDRLLRLERKAKP